MGQYLLGIDVGSSDCKVVLISTSGEIIAQRAQSYPTHQLGEGRVEQNPEDWYQVACAVTRDCVGASGIDPVQIAGAAVDGPAHNVALLDEAGAVLRPTIHWSDLRSIPQTERLEDALGHTILSTTYCRVNPAWTLPQLLWLKENEADIWARLRRILVTKDYVRYRMTGVYQTDIYDAIGTQLYDVELGVWSPELTDLLGFRAAWLPCVEHASAISGPLLPHAAEAMGLVSGIPVAVGSGDSVVEAFGIGAIEPGHCIVKLGTAANVNLVTARPYPSRQTITYQHVIPSHWFTITATNSGAATMRWFRETFFQRESEQAQARGVSIHEIIDQMADGVAPGSDGLIFHPYLKGERSPYWDPYLRGDFVGISAQHNMHHFARAVLEGVAYSIRDCLQVVAAIGEPVTRFTLIGGGSKSAVWRRILCDVLGEPLHRPQNESAAYGSALLAGVATGVFADWQTAVDQCVQTREIIHPDAANHELYDAYFDVYRSITADLQRHFHRLALVNRTKESDA